MFGPNSIVSQNVAPQFVSAPPPQSAGAVIARGVAENAASYMRREALECQISADSATPEKVLALLQGTACFLQDQGYRHKLEIMYAHAPYDPRSLPPHYFLRVHGPDPGSSYIADPLMGMQPGTLGDLREAPQFEAIYYEGPWENCYTLRQPDRAGDGNRRSAATVEAFAKWVYNDGGSVAAHVEPRPQAPVANPPADPVVNQTVAAYGHAAARPPVSSAPVTPKRSPTLMKSGEAYEKVCLLAEQALTNPVAAVIAICKISPPNGGLHHRLALLMSRHPAAATVPFINFLQLIGNLCETGHLERYKAINFLVPSVQKKTIITTLINPATAISSHWNNPAAPYFAHTLKTFYLLQPANNGSVFVGREKLIERLQQNRVDRYAAADLQSPLSFYQKIGRQNTEGEMAAQASKILFSSELMPDEECAAFERFEHNFVVDPAHIVPKSLEQLAVRDRTTLQELHRLDQAFRQGLASGQR
jgi:hypothetical protein